MSLYILEFLAYPASWNTFWKIQNYSFIYFFQGNALPKSKTSFLETCPFNALHFVIHYKIHKFKLNFFTYLLSI